jgi:hypothetical protein
MARAKPKNKSMVWVLVINHRHGTDIDVFATEDLARESLLEYVTDWWSEVGGTQPTSPYQAVDRYFQTVDGEWYELEERPVHQ